MYLTLKHCNMKKQLFPNSCCYFVVNRLVRKDTDLNEFERLLNFTL